MVRTLRTSKFMNYIFFYIYIIMHMFYFYYIRSNEPANRTIRTHFFFVGLCVYNEWVKKNKRAYENFGSFLISIRINSLALNFIRISFSVFISLNDRSLICLYTFSIWEESETECKWRKKKLGSDVLCAASITF